MIRYSQLAEAARSLAAIAEEGADSTGMVDAITRAGGDPTAVLNVAEQRAIRAALAATGDVETLRRLAATTEQVGIALTEEQKRMLPWFQASAADGICIGLLAGSYIDTEPETRVGELRSVLGALDTLLARTGNEAPSSGQLAEIRDAATLAHKRLASLLEELDG